MSEIRISKVDFLKILENALKSSGLESHRDVLADEELPDVLTRQDVSRILSKCHDKLLKANNPQDVVMKLRREVWVHIL